MQPFYKLKEKLESRGFRVIGKGSYATVFQYKETNEVIKIFQKDDCYLKFLTLISKNQDNIHFPKIFQYKKFTDTGIYKGCHMIKMEKLETITRSEWKAFIYPFIEATRFVKNKQKSLLLLNKYKQQNPSLYHTLQLLYKGRNSVCDIDIHSKNVMKRSNGTLVIVDPYEDISEPSN